MQKHELEFDLKVHASKLQATAQTDYDARIKNYSEKIATYESEQAEIQQEAKRYEGIRNDAQKHTKIFGVAIIYLQIAILLSSVAALLKQKPVWIVGLIIGAVGMANLVNGFIMFF